jgi:hypothetical protein
MTTSTFTFEQLEETVRELAAQNPNYVYPPATNSTACHYALKDGADRCIFGQSLHLLGVSEHKLEECDDLDGTKVFDDEDDDENFGTLDSGIDTVLPVIFNLELTDAQKTWAWEVQRAQDSARRWQDAIASADNGAAARRSIINTAAENNTP